MKRGSWFGDRPQGHSPKEKERNERKGEQGWTYNHALDLNISSTLQHKAPSDRDGSIPGCSITVRMREIQMGTVPPPPKKKKERRKEREHTRGSEEIPIVEKSLIRIFSLQDPIQLSLVKYPISFSISLW